MRSLWHDKPYDLDPRFRKYGSPANYTDLPLHMIKATKLYIINSYEELTQFFTGDDLTVVDKKIQGMEAIYPLSIAISEKAFLFSMKDYDRSRPNGQRYAQFTRTETSITTNNDKTIELRPKCSGWLSDDITIPTMQTIIEDYEQTRYSHYEGNVDSEYGGKKPRL